ncbi:Glutaminase 1 [Corynebacterium ciconiae DSM 44920]|uniref:glutaminase n=1 Tax=Corynebacterium ciconiae TaxID=227319 RepID=UPI0003633821|nr:glutaminase [Corynebacterium ciconiae]WKD60718.1 Glutaminase 1 [Corynebacterium ciconiae DSM 44920]
MSTPIHDYLALALDSIEYDEEGKVADYIPALAQANPEHKAIGLCTSHGRIYCAGDAEHEFSMQSVSKPFAYALALEERGLQAVLETVGVEPSGEAFNELSLDTPTNRPVNPMINAGAIAINQLINGEDSTIEERVEKILSQFSRLAGRELSVDMAVAYSELDSSDRNFAIAHMLRSYGIIGDDAHDAVVSYVYQCSINVTVRDLAVMAATLSNGGVQPLTGEQVVSEDVCHQTLAVMASAGMYDAAGRWMTSVGIPAKSGVSGGMMGCLPGQLGIATFSPPLDVNGNSVLGRKVFQRLSRDWGLHLMSTDRRGVHAVRELVQEGDISLLKLQGTLNFSAGEAFLHAMRTREIRGPLFAVDISRVISLAPVAERMLLEGLRRVREEGHRVMIIDPDSQVDQSSLSGEECFEVVTDIGLIRR